MNTVKSVYYGWATLILAGGGAYFVAKRSINADRASKAQLDREKRQRTWELESQLGMETGSSSAGAASGALAGMPPSQRTATTGLNPTGTTVGGGGGGQGQGPSGEMRDPAATRHEGEGGKSKYEASEVYRSKKGDRFS